MLSIPYQKRKIGAVLQLIRRTSKKNIQEWKSVKK